MSLIVQYGGPYLVRMNWAYFKGSFLPVGIGSSSIGSGAGGSTKGDGMGAPSCGMSVRTFWLFTSLG